MRGVKLLATAVALALVSAGSAAKAPQTWDGLVQVKAKKLALAYLRPEADFRAYSKVMFDTPEVAFNKDWQRDFNRSTMSLAGRISDSDVRDAVEQAKKSAANIFPERFTQEGFQVVTTPGPDVLRLSVGIVDLKVNAPDRHLSARSRS